MSKITLISAQTKNKDRCNLFIDGEFYSGISIETLMKFRLKVGMEIDKTVLSEILLDSEKTEALSKAVDYLSSRLKTKRQVKEYLLKKGYSEQVVWYCVEKLKDYNYINDAEYSKRYIESTSKTQGKRLLEYKLMMKGVKKDDIASAFSQTDIDAKENAKEVAVKYIKNKEKTKENLAKVYRYLIGRGFSYDEASYAIDSIKGDED